MRIAYATTFSAQDVRNWSGTPYHMSRALAEQDMTIDYIGSLRRRLPRWFKVKQTLKHYLCQQRESPRFNITAAQHYSSQVAQQLQASSADIVLSPLINPIAYLECSKPIVLWTDAVYAALVGFYPAFAYHSADTIRQGNLLTTACLSRCTRAVFSSDWAAHTAAEFYGISREKISVIPYGANLDSWPDQGEIQTMIKGRSADTIKLLFLAKSWERKGGDIALNVAQALHEAGHRVELTIVGVTPKLDPIPPYVRCLGYISKATSQGKTLINNLLSDSHFLILPSRADACPMVLAEANAFGLPCLTTHVGGISTVIRPEINGMSFGLDAPITTYCDYISNLVHDSKRYAELALSSYQEYIARLNWKAAIGSMRQLLRELV